MLAIFGWTVKLERSLMVEQGICRTRKTRCRFESCRSDYAQGIRRNPVQPLIPQDCAEGLWDAVSIKIQYGVVGEHACLLAGGSRSSRLAEIRVYGVMVA